MLSNFKGDGGGRDGGAARIMLSLGVGRSLSEAYHAAQCLE